MTADSHTHRVACAAQRDQHTFALAEVRAIHDLPLTQLLFRAQSVHREHHTPDAVQLCTLLSIKTGGCPEDCGYCGQSARHEAKLPAQPLMEESEVLAAAARARTAGATRFCMGAAWRNAKGGEQFERVLRMVKGVRELGMEACVTLGMLNAEQAKALKEAGLSAYNHNLDTSREYYGSIITTRTYDDRLKTLEHVSNAGISVCCGGIIGMGESIDDRVSFLHQLATLRPHPDSVPINVLSKVEGTPMADQPDSRMKEAIGSTMKKYAAPRSRRGALSESSHTTPTASMAKKISTRQRCGIG